MLRFTAIALLLISGFVTLRCGSSQDLNALVSIPAPQDNLKMRQKLP